MQYNNNFLFSEAFIFDAFKKLQRDNRESDEIFDNICSWYQEYKDDWLLFEDIAIDTLGFEKEVDGDYRWIKSAAKDVALVYLLDKDCMVGSTVKGQYHAVHAIKKAAERKVEWVIVTNGYEWRLLNASGVSPYEHFFAVDIKAALEMAVSDATTHIFTYMFGADFFRFVEDGSLAADIFKDRSDQSEENIEDILRSKAESILTGLCYGLKDNMNKSTFTEDDRKQIYEDAIILLYRLLFLGYAEARKLLPVYEDDPDYQDSFTKLCETAKRYYVESLLTEIGNDFDLWDRLDSQLRIYVDKNYNGGLFSNDDKSILREYRIANKHLAPCLMELSYISGRRKDYSQKIEYKDLSVRNLGAIYEGLLEYQLFIADELMVQRKSKEKVAYIKASETTLKNSDKNNLVQPGGIYLSQDAMERKETGAYYTPEDVVDYIVRNTVGKRLEELKEDLDRELCTIREELSYEPVEQRRKQLQYEIDEKTINFLKEKVLSLSIVDSAMGSGHFLVNAAYQVANYIVDILETNHWENDEINADVTYWRRKVVENCIYGIDINNLSVLLARLSLWLISVKNDKALSFIDHHLKCGNSIVGTTKDKVQYIDESIPLYNMTEEQYMRPILKKYERINEIGSNSKADVAMQHEVYEEILSDIAVIKRKLDYYLASMYAGGTFDKTEFRKVIHANDRRYFEKPEFKGLFKYADENKFFHWELEFPEVFMKGGFDIAIGNPPYVECAAAPFEHLDLVSINSQNLYAYMLENTIRKLKGYYGFIVPLSAMYSTKTSKLQTFLKENGELWISNYGIRPAKIFKRAEQRVSILIGKKANERRTYSTDYQRWYTSERKTLFSKLHYSDVTNEINWKFVPKVSEEIEIRILRKLARTSKTLGEYMTNKNENEVIYHSVGRYWLKAFDFVPVFSNEKSRVNRSTKYKSIYFKPEVDKNVVIAIINSSLFYWFWIVMSACRDFTKKDISEFPFDNNAYAIDFQKVEGLVQKLMESYQKNSKLIETNGVNGRTILQEFHPKFNKPIIDELETLVGEIYGLTDDEVEFLQKYDVRFRMSEEG